jgi:hypothetical protein
VEGVQKERNIDALLAEFTENHMVFKVVWWIAAHDDLFPVHDRVSRAVIQTLKEAGIVSPYRKSRVSTGSRSHKRTRSHFAILASCGILLPTGFQPSKGGDMVCARGPLGACVTTYRKVGDGEGPLLAPETVPLCNRAGPLMLLKSSEID